MKIKLNQPPRVFIVDKDKKIKISDCGKIRLNPNEQVTFLTKSGKEYDVVAKSWGFYATPSLNARLKEQGFKTALVKNSQGRYFVMVVDKGKLKEFKRYLDSERSYVEQWLDEL